MSDNNNNVLLENCRLLRELIPARQRINRSTEPIRLSIRFQKLTPQNKMADLYV